ncbi:hypothetical protein BBJ28_00008310 [Nothophytophthora sp. Chile5]|nr:hypothetical protein BBJ28_00008310 [Nothophytophthora sp. Chile5]
MGSDDPLDNQAGLERAQAVCKHLEKAFVGRVSWPELLYFVRYKTRLEIPESFPSSDCELLLDPDQEETGSECRQVAEAVSGIHTSRLVVLFFDGTAGVWETPSSRATQLEGRASVLFSTKSLPMEPGAERKRGTSGVKGGRLPTESPVKSFIQAWMDANRSDEAGSERCDHQTQRVLNRIHQFQRSSGGSGALIRLCGWDSVLCVNSSVLEESGSGSFRFFRLATSLLSPICQVTVDHMTLKGNRASSGVIRTFEIAEDGATLVFQTQSDTILWVSSAQTGKILCYVDSLLPSLTGKAQVLFQIMDERLSNGETQTQLYALAGSKPPKKVDMWLLPRDSQHFGRFSRHKQFHFGGFKPRPVVQLTVSAGFLLAASKDGSIVVWATTTNPPASNSVAPLTRLQIPTRGLELQSISCVKLAQYPPKHGESPIQVADTAAADLDRWEHEVLQSFDTAPLRFALYLFEDGQVVRVAVTGAFDVRLVTLDDPEFELQTFFSPSFAVKRGPKALRASRVALLKPQILRVAFVALRHLRSGVFAQKSVQELLQDLETRGVLWQTRAQVERFAASYRDSVTIEIQMFYRPDDGDHVELIQPHLASEPEAEELSSSVIVGALLKDPITPQIQLETWKLAVNWVNDTLDNGEAEGRRRLEHATQALALQSSYCIEAQRLLRTRKDRELEARAVETRARRRVLVQRIRNGVYEVISHPNTMEMVAETLLRDVQVLNLMVLTAQSELEPIQNFLRRVFDDEHSKVTAQSSGQRSKASTGLRCVEVASFWEVLETKSDENPCFRAYLSRIGQELCTLETENRQGSITWRELRLLAQHIRASTFSIEDAASLFLELGLTDGSSASSLTNFLQRLHRFQLQSPGSSSVTLDSKVGTLLSPRLMVEFLVESVNFPAFFDAKVQELTTQSSRWREIDGDTTAETRYAVQLKTRQWRRELEQLTRLQSRLATSCFSEGSGPAALKLTTTEFQQLKQRLNTPLPCVELQISSVTLERRCETAELRDRVIMDATGRAEDSTAVPLSVIYVLVDGPESSERAFQQELTLLRKLRHRRARELFLPVAFTAMNAPLLQSETSSLYLEDGGGSHCLVAESLRGWRSLADCMRFTSRVPGFSAAHWQSLLGSWSRQVLLALLALQNERFVLKSALELTTLLVSPDGCDLRLCSLVDGGFGRVDEEEEEQSRVMARVFGAFVLELLCSFDRDEGSVWTVEVCEPFETEESDSEGEKLSDMRKRVLQFLDGRNGLLTEFSSISRIVTHGEAGGELGKLGQLALLALQPASSRPTLQSLWAFAGSCDVNSDANGHLTTLGGQLTTLVELQSLHSEVLRDLRVFSEELNDGDHSGGLQQRVLERWVSFVGRLFQFQSDTRLFSLMLQQLVDSRVPSILSELAIQQFSWFCQYGDGDQGHQAIQRLLGGFEKVLQLVNEHTTTVEELQGSALLQNLLDQVIASLCFVATGRKSELAVLWRLSEPLLRALLGLEMSTRKYPMLLQWLSARRPSFGFAASLDLVPEKGIDLWWSDHTPLLPRLLPQADAVGVPRSTEYLRCLYETLEIAFQLSSGVRIPKFRLAALQQWFGPTFLERRRCFPLVFVHPLPATVWRDVAFDRLLIRLLRDEDQKIVLGGLSLLECSTRGFRFDALRPPHRSPAAPPASWSTSASFSGPEHAFALSLCSQIVVNEVKRVLDCTTRALKVLGEAGTTSRTQHPLVAILSVTMAWLVNCLHGGDAATQFWGVTGLDQLLIGHCKADSLAFLSVFDSNLLNQMARQDAKDCDRWRVFPSASRSARGVSSCSPFRLLLEEIVALGSSRCLVLLRSLLLSRTFRDQVDISRTTDSRAFASQRDLLSSRDYGKLSHAVDLARDVAQNSGTSREQLQLIVYTRALFLHSQASTAPPRSSAFISVCGEIWRWMEAAWHAVGPPLRSSIDDEAVRAQGDVVLAGFALLQTIATSPSLSGDEIKELTSFDGERDRNVLRQVAVWLGKLSHEALKHRGSLQYALIACATELLAGSLLSRRYDETALVILERCLDVETLLELLKHGSVLSVAAKQQLWSTLLYFDSRSVTTRILEADFLAVVLFNQLLKLEMAGDPMADGLNRRLEGLVLLETLVCAVNRRGDSGNTPLLVSEVCKLLLLHQNIAKEAQFVREVAISGSSLGQGKLVAVSKRLLQLACCLAVDSAAQSVHRVFLEQFKAVAVPEWVVSCHQNLPPLRSASAEGHPQAIAGLELFWRDWRGADAAVARPKSRTVVFQATRASRKPGMVSQRPLLRLPVASRPRQSPRRQGIDDSGAGGKLEQAVVLVSPVKVAPSRSTPRSFLPSEEAGATAKESVVQTLLSIDADSALQLLRGSSATLSSRAGSKKPPRTAQVEADELDSDAYSALSSSSSSDQDTAQPRDPARGQARRGRKPAKESPADEEKQRSPSLQRSSSDSSAAETERCSPPRPRRAARKARRPLRPAVSTTPRLQQEALHAVFRKYDVDGDGAISFVDLRRALDAQTAAHGPRLSDLEIQQWLSQKDRQGHDVVLLEDFLLAFGSRPEASGPGSTPAATKRQLVRRSTRNGG